MSSLSILIISISLGVLSVAGIKAIIQTIIQSITEKRVLRFIKSRPDLEAFVVRKQNEISERIIKELTAE